MRRERLHRAVFTCAGVYNLVWGGWVAAVPASFYAAAGIPTPSHPEVAGCLGMVIALYGVVYLQVARDPERGAVLAAVGLAGKTIGPIALAAHVVSGDWPASALRITVFNDLIWWLPLAVYLADIRSSRRRTRRSRRNTP